MSKIQSPFIRSIMTIGELPTQFTESMSYYEALVWLTNYIENKVVPAINEDAGAIEELREFVTHYFDSLDIEKQVNDKLDEMAETGQLQTIMAAFFDTFPLESDKIAADAITNSKIADGAVTMNKISGLTVGTSVIENNAVTNDKITSVEVSKVTGLLDKIYPVGSIYMAVNNVNPTAIFGGTWEQIRGKFLFGSDTNHALGTTGGEETHKLTTQEMPNHNHQQRAAGAGGNQIRLLYDGEGGGWVVTTAPTGENGGDQPHNNMPPYLTVNMWKRTA